VSADDEPIGEDAGTAGSYAASGDPGPDIPRSNGSPPAASADEARVNVEHARERLIATVGELGGAIDRTRDDVKRRAQRALPLAAGAVGALVALRVLLRRR
jgi:hypothetical protein